MNYKLFIKHVIIYLYYYHKFLTKTYINKLINICIFWLSIFTDKLKYMDKKIYNINIYSQKKQRYILKY